MPSRSLRGLAHFALLVFLLSVLAGPARAQVISADVAVLRTSNFTDPVAELYAAAPPVTFVRPYMIASWTLDEIEPTVITQLAVPTFTYGPLWNNIAAGATWFAFRDYRPTVSASTYLGVNLPIPNVNAFTLFSVQPAIEDWSLLVGVAYTFLYRK